jgi:hypothetical protein
MDEPSRQKGETSTQSPKEGAPFAAPSISLPKGGGAIRGMGEKFAANPVTGTGSMSVPIATSPGRFGKRLTMANAPRLELNFDPKRLFLADLNGDGCADLVYVDFDRVYFWFNQSGNRWSERQTIAGTPRISDVDSIQFADVFGTGTATRSGATTSVLNSAAITKPSIFVAASNPMSPPR